MAQAFPGFVRFRPQVFVGAREEPDRLLVCVAVVDELLENRVGQPAGAAAGQRQRHQLAQTHVGRIVLQSRDERIVGHQGRPALQQLIAGLAVGCDAEWRSDGLDAPILVQRNGPVKGRTLDTLGPFALP